MHMTPGNMQKRSSWLCPFGKAHCRTLNWWKYTIEMLKAHWAGQSSCHMNFDKEFYISLRLYQQKNYMMVVMKIDLGLITSHDRIASSSSVRDPCHVSSAQRRRILDVHLDITWVLHSKNSMRQKHDVISDDKVGYDNIEFAHGSKKQLASTFFKKKPLNPHTSSPFPEMPGCDLFHTFDGLCIYSINQNHISHKDFCILTMIFVDQLETHLSFEYIMCLLATHLIRVAKVNINGRHHIIDDTW